MLVFDDAWKKIEMEHKYEGSPHVDPNLQFTQLKGFLVEHQREVFKTPLMVSQFKWNLPGQPAKSSHVKPSHAKLIPI